MSVPLPVLLYPLEIGCTFKTQQSMDAYSNMMTFSFSSLLLLNKSSYSIYSVNALEPWTGVSLGLSSEGRGRVVGRLYISQGSAHPLPIHSLGVLKLMVPHLHVGGTEQDWRHVSQQGWDPSHTALEPGTTWVKTLELKHTKAQRDIIMIRYSRSTMNMLKGHP